MTGSILTAVNRFLTPDLVSRVASAAGFDSKLAQGATSAAVPAILAGLSKVAGTSGGAQQLADATAMATPGGLDGFLHRLSNPGPMIEQGGSLMSSLLGTGMSSAIVSGISRYLGTSEGPMKSLLSLLGPAVLGVLGREMSPSADDGMGMARALRSQAADFTAAMPPGLSKLLSATGMPMSNISDATTGTTASATMPRDRTTDIPRQTSSPPPVRRTTTNGSGYSWAYWAIPLVALAALGGYLLSERPNHEVASAPPPATTSTTSGTTTSSGSQTAALTPSQMQTALPISSYLRHPVNSRTGEPLGMVQDILITQDGRVAALIVGVERTLGLGEKRVVLPFSVIETRGRDGTQELIFTGSKEQLGNAPTYDRDDSARPAAPRQ